MKSTLFQSTFSTLILLILTSTLYSQSITIGEDGIVRCKGVSIGTTQTILGDVYEVVDRNLLIQRRNEGKDLTKMCVSNVTDMSLMFFNNHSDQPIGNWDVSSVTNMGQMFHFSRFNQPIGNWDVSSVTNMSSMFGEGSGYNHPIGDWDVSSVKSMGGMFHKAAFNHPIGNWDVSSVTDMGEMFSFSGFNHPIGEWNVSSVTNMYRMFNFSGFNQPIGDWDVSSVTNLSQMFYYNRLFNHPIGNWDVSSVTDMGGMFGESRFNQNISQWCVIDIKVEPGGFTSLSPENKPVWGMCRGISLPPKPIPLLPLNNSTDVSKSVELSWVSGTFSTKYQLQVIEGFDPVVIDTLVSDTTYIHHANLKYNFVYNWRVRGYNETLKRYGEWSSVWKFTTLIDTSIEPEEQPTQFSLYQNYPNPFNPSTQIRFSLPQSTTVRLEVFTITGQSVSVLVNQPMSSGNHTVSFDGSTLSSGVYIYKLSTPEFNQSRLMNLIK